VRLETLIAVLTQKVAKYVTAKVLHEVLHGTSNFYIEAPTIAFRNPAQVAVQLIIGTRADVTGLIIIHYTPTATTGPANSPFFLELITKIGIEIEQPKLRDPQDSDIHWNKDSNLTIRPKWYMARELVSKRGNISKYKFLLKNNIDEVPWKGGFFFAKTIHDFVNTKIEIGGLYGVEDVFFKFEDMFYICKCSL
jgi:hypothetical protein